MLLKDSGRGRESERERKREGRGGGGEGEVVERERERALYLKSNIIVLLNLVIQCPTANKILTNNDNFSRRYENFIIIGL